MRMEDLPKTGFSDNELQLIAEAVRRALAQRCCAGMSRDAVVEAVLAEARLGTRTMFGLVKAASRAAQGCLAA